MNVIYEPRGKAREYSPLAINIYRGCNHGCKYCYVPPILYLTKKSFHGDVSPRKNIEKLIEKSAKKYSGTDKQVFFSFTTDPYNNLEETEKLTQFALKKFLENKIPTAILTKSKLVLRDIDLIKKFGSHIQVGMSLTFLDKKKSLEIEPEAAIPSERIKVLKKLHDSGVKTWASIEPVIEPDESLAIIEATLPYVDVYKVGMISGYGGLAKTIDWTDFTKNAVKLLRDNGKSFYVKSELRKKTEGMKFRVNETLMDFHTVKKF